MVDRPLIHNLACFFELFRGYNLQFQNDTRTGFTAAKNSRIGQILQHPPPGGGMPLFSRAGTVAVVVEPGRDGMGAQPLAGVLIKDDLHHQRLVGIHLQVKDFVLFLIGAPVFYTPIFDLDDGDFIFSTSGNLGFDSDGNMMMRMSDNMAMDMDSGELHFVSSWDDEEDDD